jgi:hypothetical protein
METFTRASTRVSPSPKCLDIPLARTSGTALPTCSSLATERRRRIDAKGGPNAEAA